MDLCDYGGAPGCQKTGSDPALTHDLRVTTHVSRSNDLRQLLMNDGPQTTKKLLEGDQRSSTLSGLTPKVHPFIPRSAFASVSAVTDMASANPATKRAREGRIAKKEKSANSVSGAASGKRAR